MTDPTLIIVDAFTNSPFGGNPAAVVLLEAAAPEAWMQAVAAETNLSDTAFVVPRPDGDHDLRWFTPQVEVELCGHATLATGHVLGGHCRFHTPMAGVLETTAGDDGTVTMDLPAYRSVPAPAPGAAEALGVGGEDVVGAWATANGWLLVELVDADAVRRCRPHHAGVLALGGHVIAAADVTGAAGELHDVVSRVFVPAAGVAEDPVTGSAHCVIAPWLADRHGRTQLLAHQASARGGELQLEVDGERVRITGHAVTISEGRLLIPPA